MDSFHFHSTLFHVLCPVCVFTCIRQKEKKTVQHKKINFHIISHRSRWISVHEQRRTTVDWCRWLFISIVIIILLFVFFFVFFFFFISFLSLLFVRLRNFPVNLLSYAACQIADCGYGIAYGKLQMENRDFDSTLKIFS